MFKIYTLKDDSKLEIYELIDKMIRKLPRNEECIKFLSEFETFSNECEGKVRVMRGDLSEKVSVETYLKKLPLLLKSNIEVVFDS